MTFDWSGYLAVAKELIVLDEQASSSEARFRAAISRAYYAAYHVARIWLQERKQYSEVKAADGRHHAHVCDLFRHHADTSLRPIGDNLDSLRRDRSDVDYDPELDWISLEQALTDIQMAEDTINKIKQLPPLRMPRQR